MSPYIGFADRVGLDCTNDCDRREAETPGQLTYQLYKECILYLLRLGVRESFAHYAEVLGALEATKLELYRRHIAPYEDLKLKQNGDVNV